VAKGTAKGIGKGKRKPCPEEMRAPRPPTPVVHPHGENVGGARAAFERADEAGQGRSQQNSGKGSDPLQELLHNIMRRMDDERKERQEQMLQIQREQEKRDERLATFEQRMLTFQYETEQRCQALHNVQMEGFGVVAQHMAKGPTVGAAAAARDEQPRTEEAGEDRSSQSRGRKSRRIKKGGRERSSRRSPEGSRRSRSEERRRRRQSSEDDC
jgi:hypothetical protein